MFYNRESRVECETEDLNEKEMAGELSMDIIRFERSYILMKNIEDLVPKNKFDDSGIEELRMLSDEEIAPILPALLEWMKDMNWPIAREMPELLSKHPKVLVPCIIEVLQPEQSECDWKNFIIWVLLPKLDKKYLVMLKPCLERIANNPAQSEIFEETDEAAREFLQENGWYIDKDD